MLYSRILLSLFFLLLLCPFLFSGQITVKNTDTLYGIAKKNGISTELISKINALSENRIREGQKLWIPDQINNYMVKPGDSLTHIAHENHSRLDWIILLNNLNSEKIHEGQKLKIPTLNTNSTFIEKNKNPLKENQDIKSLNNRVNSDSSSYIVKKGDSLITLAKRFGVTQQQILAWNHKKSNSLNLGEKLIIQSANTGSETNLSAPISRQDIPEPNDGYSFPISRNLIRSVSPTGRGITIRMNGDGDVRSVNNGIVEYAGMMKGYNNVVIIRYGEERRSVYGYLNRVTVNKGNIVNNRQIIGEVNVVSFLGDVELYFEMRNGKEMINLMNLYPFLKNAAEDKGE